MALNSFEPMAEIGVWAPIENPNKDEFAVWAANFAVSKQNKKVNTSLKFDCIVSGQVEELDNGFQYGFFPTDLQYKLVISANDGSGIQKQYEAVLYVEREENAKEGTFLVSFAEFKTTN
ncbi:Cysteine proteinase inhibitor 5 [Striga hermonthica]|uniref:Cysteine proteinase inhibitor 5 n=1 Tax=Striga hermonthica TaxID=68872 RepID=A0A9N7RLL0_STRHE|nr:Cysteine proteinase inhibitor 5 [Striga hermonthica]